jgi:hypothetical protein
MHSRATGEKKVRVCGGATLASCGYPFLPTCNRSPMFGQFRTFKLQIMATEENLADQLVPLFPRRIFFLLWVAEMYLMILSFYSHDFLHKDYSRRAGGIILQGAIIPLLICIFILWKASSMSGRKWLRKAPSIANNYRPPNRAFQIFVWALPTLGIIGMIWSVMHFK